MCSHRGGACYDAYEHVSSHHGTDHQRPAFLPLGPSPDRRKNKTESSSAPSFTLLRSEAPSYRIPYYCTVVYTYIFYTTQYKQQVCGIWYVIPVYRLKNEEGTTLKLLVRTAGRTDEYTDSLPRERLARYLHTTNIIYSYMYIFWKVRGRFLLQPPAKSCADLYTFKLFTQVHTGTPGT